MIFRMITHGKYTIRNYETFQGKHHWKQTIFVLFLQNPSLLITLKNELHCEKEKLCMLPKSIIWPETPGKLNPQRKNLQSNYSAGN